MGMGMLEIYFISLAIIFITAFIVASKYDDTYPGSWYVNKEHNFVITEPFWIKHEVDGQVMKNPLYTDDGIHLNKVGQELFDVYKKIDPYFGSNKRPND